MRWNRIRKFLSIGLLLSLMGGSFIFRENNSVLTMSEVVEVPIFSVDKEEKVSALTFDINWAENDYIYSILDTLNKYNVKGTFFIMGGWVNYSEDNVTKLKAIDERGNEIGNHSYKHPSFSSIGEERIKEELRKTDETIEKYTGKKPRLFRFPSGDYNKQSYRTVKSEGYVPIQWDVDSVDWKQQGEEIEYNRIKKNIKPGSILLFHNNAKYTPKNLERLLKELTDEGYKFVTVSELIYQEEGYIDPNGVQHRK
ncbi:polysaccharide deacetylase family protein [Clostridium sp. LP20]|uniref:polysaccharide deacetylase family protein n=1 Tax=Clostridium sp. LP20 TaxID=3418665 RepID=UPI003EE4C9B1